MRSPLNPPAGDLIVFYFVINTEKALLIIGAPFVVEKTVSFFLYFTRSIFPDFLNPFDSSL